MGSRLTKYAIAAAALALAIAVRWLLDPILGDALPLVTLFGAVAAAAWTGGITTGLAVAVAGYLICDLMFIEPRGALGYYHVQNVVGALAAFATCAVIIALCEAMRRAQHRAEMQRETLRVTLASMGDAVITTDEEGMVASMNRVAERLTGWSIADAAGRPLSDVFRIVNEYTRAPVSDPVAKVLASGQIVGLANHTTLIARDGDETPIDDSAAPIRDLDGAILGVVLIFRDIAQRRRDEEARRRLAAIVESSNDAIIGKSLDGTILSWNKAAERLYGYTAAEAMGQSINIIVPPDRPDELSTILERLKQGESIKQYDTLRVHKDGRRLEVAVNISPLLDETGQVIGASAIARDVSEQRRVEQAVRRSEERLRMATQTGKVGIWEWDIATNRVTWTDSLYEIHGVDRDSFSQTVEGFSSLVHPDDRDRVHRSLEQALAGEAPYEVTFRSVRPDGRVIWLFTNAQVVRDEGRPVRMLGATTDITQLKETEEALRARNERLSVLSQAAALLLHADEPDTMLHAVFEMIAPMFGLDAYFNYMVNETGLALRLVSCAGVPQETQQAIQHLEFGQAICGKAALLRQPIVACDIQRSDDPSAQLVKSLGIRAYACNPLVVNNQLVGTLSFASRSRDVFEPGDIEFMSTICHYVSMAGENLRLVHQLREADRRKDEFLATLAHELRNPLAPVRTSVEILNMEKDLPVGIRWARDVIDRQMQHMARLLEDLMDVSRVSKGRIELRRERLDLCRIVQDAVETSRPLIDQHQHELTIELPTVPLYVDADRVRMAQVFSNLLNNAAKFTQPKGHISLSVEPRDGHAVVTVRDSGMGIPSDKLTSIFEMFSQVQKPEDRSKGGLGIGLALARQLVELHGGTIQGCSEGEGKGSIFVVRLPLLHDHAPPPSPDGRDGAPLSSQLRVLVVDDNHDAADSLAKLLSLTGNDVATAYDGEAAVTKAELFRPDVIFLDLGLPKQNGYQACKRIRELPWGAQATVIAVTGWGQDVDRLRTQTAGFDQHLVKPVDPVTLLQMLANHDKNKL